MKVSKWHLPGVDSKVVSKLQLTMGISRVLAEMLVRKGFLTPNKAWRYLRPSLQDIAELFEYRFFQELALVFVELVNSNDKPNVLICTDYDVDGITGGVIIYKLLRLLGKNVFYCVSNRNAGYGMFINADLEERIRSNGINVLVMVDVGAGIISELVALADKLNLEVIVIDHHIIKSEIRGQIPNIEECEKKGIYIFNSEFFLDLPRAIRDLSASAICFVVGLALKEDLENRRYSAEQIRHFAKQILELATLGIIADSSELSLYNRILTYHGLKALASPTLPANKFVMEKLCKQPYSLLTEFLFFEFFPRINACARVAEGNIAFEFMIADDQSYLDKLYETVDSFNDRRKNLQKSVYNRVLEIVRESMRDRPYIYVFDGNIPAGILSVVTTRLFSELRKPTFVVTCSPNHSNDGLLRGSARVSFFNLLDFLANFSDILLDYGGHRGAAGFTLRGDKLKKFEENLEIAFTRNEFVSSYDVSATFHLDELTEKFLNELSELEPLSQHSVGPVFLCPRAEIYGDISLLDNGVVFFLKQKDRIVKSIMKVASPEVIVNNLRRLKTIDVLCFPRYDRRIFCSPSNADVYLDIYDFREAE